MVRFYNCLLLLFLTIIVSACSDEKPTFVNNQILSDTVILRRHVCSLISKSSYRNHLDTAELNRVASYIAQEFSKNTHRIEIQKFKVKGREYKNVIASFGPENAERIIIGAHYDVYGSLPGADDNASGVAGILELSRLLKNQSLKYRIDIVAYTLEEPPYFRSDGMGSFVHAQSLFTKKVPVKGMICLEMIGYFSDAPNSQDYPFGPMKWFYGEKANYILVVQKFGNGSFGRQFNKLIRKNARIETKFLRSPKFLTGVDFSDHRNYWDYGYNALMVTNTSFYRNKNYHTSGDLPETLDFKRMSQVVDEVYLSVLNLK